MNFSFCVFSFAMINCIELNNSEELRKNSGFKSKLNYNQLREVFAHFTETRILEFLIKRLNKVFLKEKRTSRYILVDTTDIQFDINLDKRYYPPEELEEKDFELGYSSSKSHYIGGKLIITIDYDTYQPLTMLFHPGAVHDSKIFHEILHELKKRRILRYKDIIIADKGFTSYKNYELGISRYKIVSLIFLNENMDKNKILGRLS